ncbi:hypothetical protein GPX89_12985 [Nocardia sp. ET3-3]|uniref:Uncharacterized protein n=1 Tax=Nocardia terrae TaxID=2675851 RepID=A0A7K1UUV7_9NOCA|nr:hypothetical protein [Nocardia terrae]MVU78156.1 hypothetical protein [Nocardia terrae]
MDGLNDVEIRAVREIIDAVEDRLRHMEITGTPAPAPRSEIYATVICAVIASARASGHHGSGSIAQAPLLDEILIGSNPEPWRTPIHPTLIDKALTP